MKIAFAGTGLMGSRMVSRLLQAGRQVTVYNRTVSKLDPLVAQGAAVASSPAELAKDADVYFTMLSDPETVEILAIGDSGFLPALKEKSIWIDCSTVNPSFTRKMAAAAGELGVRFMDAPVTGSTWAASSGELTFFVGGALNDLESVRPLLETMGKKIIHAGGVGMGSAIKIVNNHLGGTAMLAFCEAMTLGEAMGLSKELLLETFTNSAVVPALMTIKRPKFEKGDYEPEFPLKLMKKDLHLASICGFEYKTSLPSASAAKEIYTLAQKAGLGEEDYAAIYKFMTGEYLNNNE